MSEIIVKKPTDKELKELGVESWSPWGCDISEFDWEYSDRETAYVEEGRVTVVHEGGETVIKAGDLVTFPKGMKCRWIVQEPIRKVYRFG